MKKKLILFGAVIYCLSLSCNDDLKSTNLFQGEKRLKEAYGLCAHIGSKYMKTNVRDSVIKNISQLGVDIVRTDLYWDNIQTKTSTTKSYVHLDNMFKSLENNNLRSLSILDYSIIGCEDIWNHTNEWGDYIKGIVKRFDTNVDYWEIWNEENHPHFWQGVPSAKQYLEILRKASTIIRNEDKHSTVLMGGLAGMDEKYLEDLFDLGGDRYFDIVNFHYYPNIKPELLISQFDKLKKILRKYHCNKKVWLTEIGYSTFPSENVKLRNQVSEEQQAFYLPRIFLIAYCFGVEKVFWYCHKTEENDENNREHYFGIVHNNLAPKKAYFAYKTLIKMMPNGSKRPELKKHGNLYICSWTTPMGDKVKAYWTTHGQKLYNFNEEDCFDIYGNKISNNEIKVSPSIIYVKGNTIKRNH